MSHSKKWFLACFAGLSVVIAVDAWAAGWHLETLDTITGEHPVVVTDTRGNPHVFYYGTDGLKHMWKDSADWICETLPYGSSTFAATLDSLDRPCIAYVHYGDFMEMFVSFAYWDGGSWQREQLIQTATNGSGSISMVLDSNQRPHIAVNMIHDYGPAHSSILYYFLRDASGVWTTEPMDGMISDIRLAVDPNDSPILIYQYRTSLMEDYEWRFRRRENDQWIVEPLIFDGEFVNIGTPFYCREGFLQFIYTEQFRMTDTGRLMRAIRIGDEWTRECLAETYYIIYLPDAVLDLENMPHSVFFLRELDPEDISYIKHTYRAGSFWITESIDADPEFIRFPRIATTSGNDLHVVYVYDDSDHRELRYAYRPPAPLYHLVLEDDFLTYGDWFFLSRTCEYFGAEEVILDEYIIFDVYGSFWFWPSWTQIPDRVSQDLKPGDFNTETILDFQWPANAGSGSGLAFWGGLLNPETMLLLALDRVEFSYE
ncbi:MAG TPA: hypothetical protein PLV45_03815 [bacterium]|nr:hypothetical protein [bacterium]